MKQNLWQQSLSAVTIAALAAPVISLPASAQLTGQARCAKQSTAIFAQRSSTSAVVRTLTENQSVTLSENAAQNGFIGVSAPTAGFVQTATLKLCPPKPEPQGTCRRVSQPQGLIVRQRADINSPIVGNVAFNSQVFLTTNPATTGISGGRIWVNIAKPVAGWVSNGLQNVPGTNLVYCQ